MSKSSVTLSKSKMNAGLAIGVLGVLVLIGSDTYAAEPVSKRKPATVAATTRFAAETRNPLASEKVTIVSERLERMSASAGTSARQASELQQLHDLSEMTQVDINRAMKRLDRTQ